MIPKILMAIGVALILAPFVLLCRYSLTDWAPVREFPASVSGIISVILGWISISIAQLMDNQ